MAYTIPARWIVNNAVVLAKLTTLSSDLTFFGTPPCGQAAGPNTQSIPNNVTTQITTMTSVFVAGSMTFASNQLTVPVDGIYYVKAVVSYATALGSVFPYQAILKAAGTEVARGSRLSNNASSPLLSIAVWQLVSCVATETLTLFAYQNTGAARNAGGRIFAKWISN